MSQQCPGPVPASLVPRLHPPAFNRKAGGWSLGTRLVPAVSRTCPGSVQDMSRQCPGHVPAVPRTCPGSAQDMSRQCPGHVPAVSRTCSSSAQDESQPPSWDHPRMGYTKCHPMSKHYLRSKYPVIPNTLLYVFSQFSTSSPYYIIMVNGLFLHSSMCAVINGQTCLPS